jgi:hypothetical protein
MSQISKSLVILCVITMSTLCNDDPFSYGTSAVQNLAAKNGPENEVIASSIGYSADDKSQGASYARGDGPSDANVQLSADMYTDSNAVSAATDAGSASENGFAVSNVKSELAKDDNKLYNSNPKYWRRFPGIAKDVDKKPYRTYTLSTNMVTGRNTNSATRGISSRRHGDVSVTSNRSQNNGTHGRAISSALSLSNGTVNNAKVHSQLKARAVGDFVTRNDVAAARVKGIAAAVQKGDVDAQGFDSEASIRQQGENLGFGFTQTAGSANADDRAASARGHIKSFYNPNRKQAGQSY